MKKLKPEHLQKIQEGRKKHLERTKGLVCTINEHIQIWVDQYQFILKINGSVEGYYSDLLEILETLLDCKAKELMLADKRKNLIGVFEAITEARRWIDKIVSPILKGTDSKQNNNPKTS